MFFGDPRRPCVRALDGYVHGDGTGGGDRGRDVGRLEDSTAIG